MNVNRNALNFWLEKERKVEAAHLLDLCENVLSNHGRLVTPFLSPAMANWFGTFLKGTGLSYLPWGGFEDAERVRFVLAGADMALQVEDAQVSLLQAVPQKKEIILQHRDILGSLLGLGLNREVIGDIRQGAFGSIIVVADQLRDYILQNWASVGREKIQAANTDSNITLPVAGIEKRVVTSSPRLDALTAAGFNLSRSAAQELIVQGKVRKNDLVTIKPDLELSQGDVISCRGKGKLKILDEDAKTRKGKYAWRIFIYSDLKKH